jgi:hypothetical protein
MTVMSYMPLGISPMVKTAEAEETNNINNLASEAISNNYDLYMSGTAVDGGGYATFTSYDAYVLIEAGVDISQWKYDGISFSDSVIALIDATIANEGINGQSSAKRVAQDYLVAKSLGETEKANQLIEILKNRQMESGEFDSGTYSIYTNLAAYDLLAREGDLNDSGLNLDNAVMYVLNNQDTTKAWPIEDPDYWITNDFMATSQAVRVLEAAENNTTITQSAIQTAITDGITWLQSKQQDDGSYIAGYDDAVSDTSEMIYTAKVFGEDPSTWVNALGKSPVDFMINSALIDGSFGNINSTTWALDAYLHLKTMELSFVESDTSSSSSSSISDSSFKVKVAVIGEDGETVYGPRSVSISSEDEYGSTAMGALDATGLSWEFGDTDGFVEEIDGQENQGSNGWMYAVNGKSPSVLATNKSVSSGDKVLWWYSSSAMEGVPDWPSSSSTITTTTTTTTESTDDVKETLENNSGKIIDKNIILNSDNRMTQEEARVIANTLKANSVSLSGYYEGKESILSDGEVSILLPADVLDDNTTITSIELEETDNPKQFAVKLNSSVYEFGPNGTKFNESITMSIKISIDENIDIDKLSAAWFDVENKKWIPIVCSIDVNTGIVTFKTDHFTKFAVIESENRVSFDDVDDNVSWAKDAIEILAGEGIINGTGSGFEPQRTITRAEFMKLIVGALGYELNEATGTIFSDVDKSDWFASVVECGYNNNLVAVGTDGKFRPNDVISRNEIAVILSRLEDKNNNDEYDLTMTDVSNIPEWAMNGVRFAVKEGLMSGYEDNTFMGSEPMTRAEVAVVIYRYLSSNAN